VREVGVLQSFTQRKLLKTLAPLEQLTTCRRVQSTAGTIPLLREGLVKTPADRSGRSSGGVKGDLPPLYTTIHLIHCLTNEELALGVRDGHIHPNVTQGSLNRWIRHQRFHKGSKVIPEDFTALVQVMTPPAPSEEVLERFKQELEGLVSRYGFRTQYEDDQSMVEVRQQRSQERSQVLVQRLTQDLQSTWQEADADLKNLFSLSSLEDFVLAPMSSFTGFLNRLRGGRNEFWSKCVFSPGHSVARNSPSC